MASGKNFPALKGQPYCAAFQFFFHAPWNFSHLYLVFFLFHCLTLEFIPFASALKHLFQSNSIERFFTPLQLMGSKHEIFFT